jgi:hypothetical protein
MKKYYVYELYNLVGTVEHVGESVNPEIRFKHHTKAKHSNGNGSGRFYGRTDISMHIAKEFSCKKEAWHYQCELQKEYGLKTDKEKLSQAHKDKPHSNETKIKIGLTSKGRTFSSESKQKMSEAAIKRYANLKNQPSTIS